MIKIKEINSKSIISKSKLPGADYVINPYIGCTHKCIYCYAEFMKRFTNHKEPWGEFLDIKNCCKKISPRLVNGKKVLISSVTDPYNHYEIKYMKTRKILEELALTNADIDILTKSALVCRDIDLIKKIKNIKVGISINTVDDNFRKDIEPYAGSIESRIDTLKKLKLSGIETYAFIGPIFPGITDIEKIVSCIGDSADYYYFENLNLRGTYKKRVLEYINEKWPDLNLLYNNIYNIKNNNYWESELEKINESFKNNKYNYKCYFYHEKIRKN